MRVAAVTLLSLVVPTLAACLREGAPPVAPVDVAVSDVAPSARGKASDTAGGAAKDRCTARLTTDSIDTGATCTLDERLSKGPGTLVYPCSGTGPAEARFGEHRFEGTATDGAIALTLVTEIDWEDGCHWQTKQRLGGDIHGARPLAWTYTEAPVSGTSCYGTCKASAEVVVEDAGSPDH
ncbi:MAG: hypothetical protein JWP97_2486 [Labilithrix sp.]|nr:hypothetical protein [Labilithrix sp.]